MTRLSAACAVFTATGLAWVAASEARRPQVFRAAVDYVLIDVSVRQAGRPVADLQPADFVLLDGGVRQPITNVTRDVLPVDVTLLVDWSGSVRGVLQSSLGRAIEAVRARLRPADRAEVVTFNHEIRHRGVVDRTTTVLDSLGTPEGQTSLIDAVAMSLIRTPATGRRQMTIVFTDGFDSTSFLDGSTLTELAQRGSTALFVVALGNQLAPDSHPPHEALFRTLTDVTGGALTVIDTDALVGRSFVDAFDAFRTAYVLTYVYQGPVQAGWHPVEVRVARRGMFDVRARLGYVSRGASSE